MLTVFIVMTGDAWVSPMMDGISVLGPHAAVFYIVVVLVGTYLMMNLLVAVLLHLFSQKSDAETASAKGDGSEDKDSSSKSDEDVQIMRADDYALGCYAPDDPFRRQCREWIESPTVDAVMTVTVFASSLAADIVPLRAQRIRASFHRRNGHSLRHIPWTRSYMYYILLLYPIDPSRTCGCGRSPLSRATRQQTRTRR